MFSATIEVFARVCKVDTQKFALILLEWKTNNICDIIEDDNGIITVLSRRIRRDQAISAIRSENGSKGGSKTQAKGKAKQQAKSKQNHDNDSEGDNEADNEKLKEYDLWTEQITAGEDQYFEQMFMKEMIPAGEHIQFWILDHRDLINRYPKMRPPNQDAFRKSCLKHIRENHKKPINGTSKKTDAANARRTAFAAKHSSNPGSKSV